MDTSTSADNALRPFFIVGCTRSGTTMISQILDGHSRLAVYHESHFYHLLHRDLHRYGDLRETANMRRFLTDVREVLRRQKKWEAPTEEEFFQALPTPTFEGVLAAMLQLYAHRQGKIRGGDKTPGHHMYLAQILQNLPNSRVIFVLRDPRDAVAAIREKFGLSLKGAIALWNAAFVSYRKFYDRVRLVRYEELVRRPEESVESMCAFLDESCEPGMLRFFERIPASLAKIRYNQDLLEPANPSHIGRFRELPRRDIECIERACGIGMEALGYEFSGVKPQLSPIKPPTRLDTVIDRLRFYGLNRGRWRRGWTRWKIILRLRARYFLLFEWMR